MQNHNTPGYPNLICTGAHKAGTTWLYRALSNTPGIFTPLIKELHYFSELYCPQVKEYSQSHRERQLNDARMHLRRRNQAATKTQALNEQLKHITTTPVNDDWYKGIFSFAHQNEFRTEVCPSYMLLPDIGIRHMLKINPSVKILFVIRDPIDRAWSNIRDWLKSDLIQEESAIFESNVLLKIILDHTQYSKIISRYESICSTDCLSIMIYDDLQNRPDKFFQDILIFIGRDSLDSAIDLTASVHKGMPIPIPNETRSALLDLLMPEYEFLFQRYPDLAHRWLSTHRNALAKK